MKNNYLPETIISIIILAISLSACGALPTDDSGSSSSPIVAQGCKNGKARYKTVCGFDLFLTKEHAYQVDVIAGTLTALPDGTLSGLDFDGNACNVVIDNGEIVGDCAFKLNPDGTPNE